MKREVIEITFATKSGEVKELCERFEFTSTGYVAIDYVDGGYNCVYSASHFKSAKLVMVESLFPDERKYLKWKHMFDKDAFTIYDRLGKVISK